MEVHEPIYRTANHDSDDPPLVLHELRHVHNHLSECRQVGTETLEQRFELRDHENQKNDADDDCNHEDGYGIKQCLFDFLL